MDGEGLDVAVFQYAFAYRNGGGLKLHDSVWGTLREMESRNDSDYGVVSVGKETLCPLLLPLSPQFMPTGC